MYANSNANTSQKPSKPVVKSCKLLFRTPFDNYNLPKSPFPDSQFIAKSVEQQAPFGIDQSELNETTTWNSWENSERCSQKLDSKSESGSRYYDGPTNVKPQASASFSGLRVSNKAFPKNSYGLQGETEIRVPKADSIHLPKILRPSPIQAGTFENNCENFQFIQTNAEDIERIYKMSQFPQSVSKNLFLDDYHLVIHRKRLRKRERERPTRKNRLSLCNDLDKLCPHCEIRKFSRGNESPRWQGKRRLNIGNE